jgi:hypothetical protein
MSRTVFVNPSRKRGRRRNRRRNFSAAMGPRANPRRRRRRSRRRNSGIAPFVQNPLIMSNPRRRRRHSNPLAGALSVNNLLNKGLTYGGGAIIAVGANALVLNRVDNVWLRNGLRFGGGILGAALLKGDLGAATAGAMFYPMFQELAAQLLGKELITGNEADMDVLAADLEDVMDDLQRSDLSDGDDYEMDLADDQDDILG